MQEYAGMWKVAIRKLHRINKLTDSDLIEYHGNNVFMKDTLTNDERIVLMDVISLISNVDEFAKELIIEANLISSGKLPDNKKDFRSNWIGFIAECVHEASIDADEMDELIDEIDFTTDEYTSNELGSINMVLDLVRLNILTINPAAIEHIDNPSFELLMFANGME